MVGNNELSLGGDQVAVRAGPGSPCRPPNSDTPSRSAGSQQRRKDRGSPRFSFPSTPFFSVLLAAFSFVFISNTVFWEAGQWVTLSTKVAFGISVAIARAAVLGRKMSILAGGLYFMHTFGGFTVLRGPQLQWAYGGAWWHSLYSSWSAALAWTVLLMDFKNFTQCQLGKKCTVAFPLLDKLAKVALESSLQGDRSFWGISVDYVCLVCSTTAVALCLWVSLIMLESTLDISCTGVLCTLIALTRIVGDCLSKGFAKAFWQCLPRVTIGGIFVGVVYYSVPVSSQPIVASSVLCSMVVVYIAGWCFRGPYSKTVLLLGWLAMVGLTCWDPTLRPVAGGRYAFLNQMLHLVTIGVGYYILLVLHFSAMVQDTPSGNASAVWQSKAARSSLRTVCQLDNGERRLKEERATRSSLPPPQQQQLAVEKPVLGIVTRTVKKETNTSENTPWTASSGSSLRVESGEVKPGQDVEDRNTNVRPLSGSGALFRVVGKDTTDSGVKRLDFLLDHLSTVESTQGVSQHDSLLTTPIVVPQEHMDEVHGQTDEKRMEVGLGCEGVGKTNDAFKVDIIALHVEEDSVEEVTEQTSETVKDVTLGGNDCCSPPLPHERQPLHTGSRGWKLVDSEQRRTQLTKESPEQTQPSRDSRKKPAEGDMKFPERRKVFPRSTQSVEMPVKRSGNVSERVPVGAIVKVSRQNQLGVRPKREISNPSTPDTASGLELSETLNQKEHLKPGDIRKRALVGSGAEAPRGCAKGVNPKGDKVYREGLLEGPRAAANNLKQKEKTESRGRGEKAPKCCTSDNPVKRPASLSQKKIGVKVGDAIQNSESKVFTKMVVSSGGTGEQLSDIARNSTVAAEARDIVTIPIPQPRSWCTTPQDMSFAHHPTSVEQSLKNTSCWATSSEKNGCEGDNDDPLSLLLGSSCPPQALPSLGGSPLDELSHVYLSVGPAGDVPEREQMRSIPTEARNALENFAKVWERGDMATRQPEDGVTEGGTPKRGGRQWQSTTGAWAGIPPSGSTSPKGFQVMSHEAGNSPSISATSDTITAMPNSGLVDCLEHQILHPQGMEHHFAQIQQYSAAQQTQLVMMADGRLAMYPMYPSPYMHHAVVMSPPQGETAVTHHHLQHQQPLAFYPQVALPLQHVPSGVWSPYTPSPNAQ